MCCERLGFCEILDGRYFIFIMYFFLFNYYMLIIVVTPCVSFYTIIPCKHIHNKVKNEGKFVFSFLRKVLRTIRRILYAIELFDSLHSIMGLSSTEYTYSYALMDPIPLFTVGQCLSSNCIFQLIEFRERSSLLHADMKN